MALINIDSVFQESIRQMKNCTADSGIELMSYKRDRTISLTSMGDDKILLSENGYVEAQTVHDLSSLAKELKKAIKREFPRSRKVRLFKFDDPEQLERHHQKI